MDKYIETFAIYFVNWQQTAIDNPQYSIVLAVAAVFIGGLIVLLWMRATTVTLQQKVMIQNHALEQSEQKREQLEVTQKNDVENLVSVQQQVEQLTKDVQEKQVQMDEMDSTVNDKQKLIEHLQEQFNEQKTQISQYVLDQAKIEVLEKEASEFADDLNNAKQKGQALEVDINIKNEQIAQLEQAGQSVKNNMDTVSGLENQLSELESQLKELSSINEAESKNEQVSELENTVLHQNKQLTEFNSKLQSLLIQPQIDIVSTDTEKDSDGFINKLLSKLSLLDNKKPDEVQSESQSDIDETSVKDAWQVHQMIVDQLIEQSTTQTVNSNEQIQELETEDLVVEVAAEIIEEEPIQVAEESIVEEDSTNFKDPFQEKLKGLYQNLFRK